MKKTWLIILIVFLVLASIISVYLYNEGEDDHLRALLSSECVGDHIEYPCNPMVGGCTGENLGERVRLNNYISCTCVNPCGDQPLCDAISHWSCSEYF